MSLKEMNDKLILGRENRNKRISIYNLPKINRKWNHLELVLIV